MRNYVEMKFGKFHEHSTNLGIDIDVEIWRRDQDRFDARVAELRAQIAAAGGDWTGTLTLETEAYWILNKDNFCQIIEDFAAVNVLATGYSTQDIVEFGDSPRGAEKRRFRLVPIKRS